jgi:hypothetical protein
LPTQAIILHLGSPGPNEVLLGRFLDFFAVPWKQVEVCQLANIEGSTKDYVAFGSIHAVVAAVRELRGAALPAAFYAYADDERGRCISALQFLFRDTNVSLKEAPEGKTSLCVSAEMAELAGPMAGLMVFSILKREDAIVINAPTGGNTKFVPVILAGGAPVFLRLEQEGVPVYLCTSSYMVDIDQPLVQGYYDVKTHFCSAVPLLMFIRFMFPTLAWHPQELSACLIIDDPLLKPQYGFCDFAKLRDLMRQHGFTTNIAFIPWNWRRTSSAAADFFKNESTHFSISIHGCDHTAGEFGATSTKVLHSTARLAQSRMQNHQARTGIQHDPIMVFPQGVFSSACPDVLKQNGFLAAVNTEIVPVDSNNARTRIRDVWDVAILTYGSFPIFTRRYPSHGLENFAFDLLLGKPCLIVTHQDFFKDAGAGLIELIDNLASLRCSLNWRPLGEVIRRACRRRATGTGMEEVEMYGSELLIGNSSEQPTEGTVRKRKGQHDQVSDVLCEGKPITWETEGEHLVFRQRIDARSEKYCQVVYQRQAPPKMERRSVGFELSVAARRVLSEFRDNYFSKSRFLNAPIGKLKNIVKSAF